MILFFTMYNVYFCYRENEFSKEKYLWLENVYYIKVEGTCVGGRCDDTISVNELKKLKVQNQEIDAIGKRKVD